MADDLSRILSADLEDDGDLVIEGTLRPRTLDEYIGQREVKANLSVLLTAARGRGEAADHVLLYGPPGLGKTTLATIIARELGVNVKYASGPGHRARRRPRRDPDLARRARRPVHRRDPPPQPGGRGDPLSGDGGLRAGRDDRQGPVGPVAAPEPQAVHGGRRHDPCRPDQQPVARPVRGDLPARLLHGDGAGRDRRPLGGDPRRRDRAGGDRAIARRGRGTPRIVNRLLKRVRDHAQVHGDGHVDEATATAAMRAHGDRRRGPRLDRSQAPRRDRPEVRVRTRSGSRRWPPSCPRRSRPSRTSTSRSCSGSASSTARRRAGSPRTSARAHLSGLGYEIPPPRRLGPGHARAVGPAGGRRPAGDRDRGA